MRLGQFVAMPDHYGDWNTTEPSRFNGGKYACFFVSSADFFHSTAAIKKLKNLMLT